MTILVYGEKASRTQENQMLQAFLERLEPRWGTSADWIVVFANSLWNGAEIDLVCILPSAILVADFKSHRGRLTGTENGPWQANGVLVKGGRKENPYQQLRDNKFSILNWLESKSLLTGRNLGHISAGVVFGGSVEDHLELSAKVRSWFYPTDLDNCTALLTRLASPELQIDRKEALEIIHRLGVQPVEWLSSRPQVRDIDQETVKPLARTPLTGHQREALQALTNFVSMDELVTFSVLGMTSTGKSRLLADLVSDIERFGRKPIVLAPNRRLADSAEVESSSIYGHLYTGNASSDDEPDKESEQKTLKIIPLRACDDAADCVYLLDDAHLLGNSQFSTPDGKQYGSGRLLSDFFDFADIDHGKRKVIFFGDPYQVQRGGSDESVLTGAFQQSRGLKHQSLELIQLIDTTSGSAKLANAVKLVSAIGAQKFAALELVLDDSFRVVEKKTAANEILECFRTDPGSVWYLAETHDQINALTQWVRERLRGKQILDAVEVGDLLEIYVSPDMRDAFGASVAMLSGGRVTVAGTGQRTLYQQGLSWIKNGPVTFHSIKCGFRSRADVEFELFEEFLTAEKPELDKETAVAESVWRNAEVRYKKRKEEWERKQELPGVESRPPPKEPEQPLPRPAFTYARYGYASTAHHAQGMSQPICYVNCDHAAGRHSEGFFRWLYSALTVAERELVLVNFTDIHPYDSAIWNAGAVTVATDIPIGAGWSFQPNGIASEKDQLRSLPPGLEQSKDVLRSVAIWLRIANTVEASGWQVAKVACHPYQEQYDIVGPQGEQSRLRIAYNGKNVITAMHINHSVHWSLLADLASGCLEANGYSPEADGLLRSARSRLGRNGWKIVSATETAYRLLVTIARGYDERVSVEINFDKQGLVSSVRPLQTTDLGLLDEIKEALL